ncbi:MAG: response regulator [Hyphomonadaceae bacterium]|nr:response regulator [Hyphomonadaceae bacterium]
MKSLAELQVLVVDDNAQMRFLLKELLRAGGVRFIYDAPTADAAIALMRVHEIDIVTVDWCMQPVDGIALANRLRRSPDSPNPYVSIVMISAHSERSRVEGARDAGVNGFLVKPISARLVFDRISAALNDNRPFVRSASYFGPDRRHAPVVSYMGPFRRETDKEQDALLLDAG